MARDKDGGWSGGGDVAAAQPPEPAAGVARGAALLRPGDPEHAAYPLSEAEYWREAYAREPYHDPGRSAGDYGPAYELGWVSYQLYGGPFDVAERVVANDWLVRKGVSTLSWAEARPAVRAAWQRAENARSYVTDGSAGADRVGELLQALLENACDGELGFREAAGHARTASLAAHFETLASQCAAWSQHWRGEVERHGGAVGEGGTVGGAAQRAWLQIRSLFGGAGDAALLEECERGLDDIGRQCRDALRANLPRELHEAAQHQLERAQRHADHLRRMREDAVPADASDDGSPSLSR